MHSILFKSSASAMLEGNNSPSFASRVSCTSFFFLFPRCGQSYLGRYCSLSEYALELCIPQWEREKTQGKAQMGATSPAEVAQQHSAVTADTRGPVGSRFTHLLQGACSSTRVLQTLPSTFYCSSCPSGQSRAVGAAQGQVWGYTDTTHHRDPFLSTWGSDVRRGAAGSQPATRGDVPK